MGRHAVAGRREVEPHSLVNSYRRWYLVAWDRRRRGTIEPIDDSSEYRTRETTSPG